LYNAAIVEREVRYCTTEDGVRIAYWVEGEGPAVVITPDFIEATSLGKMHPPYEAFMRKLGEGRTLVRYDGRGLGLSQRHAEDWSQDATTLDTKAVVDAVGLERFTLWASTTGAGRGIKLATEYPERMDALILYGVFPVAVGSITGFTEDVVRGFASMALGNWTLAARIMSDLAVGTGNPDISAETAAWYVAGVEGKVVHDLLIAGLAWDTRDLLGQVRCPTLILHRAGDTTVPLAVARDFAALIPNSRIVQLQGTTHALWLGDSAAVHEAVDNFLDALPETRRRSVAKTGDQIGAFRTVLFTDLVGHTEMMSRLGDDRGRDVLREHERITREVLKAHGGTEVKTMGDGFMASFGSVTKAVECAVALQRAFTEREGEPLSVRVGLTAGEPIEEDGDLFGATVILASRIAAKAGGGEILVADTVHGLCSGKGFLFSDRGEFVAKGFEEPVRVYEVSWRHTTAS